MALGLVTTAIPYLAEWAESRGYFSGARFLPHHLRVLGPALLIVGFGRVIDLWGAPGKIPPNACRNCGYNLTGNASGTCPECGRRIPI